MIRVYQSTFGGPDAPPRERGDCFSACLASILELPLAEVPRFCEVASDDDRARAVAAWLKDRGLGLVSLIWSPEWGEVVCRNLGFTIISGKSPRGDWNHAVVGLGDQPCHDPRADAEGPPLCEHSDDWPWEIDLFVPFNPLFVRRHARPEAL